MVKVNKNIFYSSFLILTTILIILFFSIIYFENLKKQSYEEDFKLLNQQMLIDDLFLTYIKDTNNLADKCIILEKQYQTEYLINRELLEKLKLINKNALVPTSNSTKYAYVLTNVKLWLYHKKLNYECDNNKKTILYFYSETINKGKLDRIKDEKTNSIYEKALNDLTNRCENVNIFAIPYNKEIIILNQIISDYNVLTYPSIVIDNNVYYKIDYIKNYDCN